MEIDKVRRSPGTGAVKSPSKVEGPASGESFTDVFEDAQDRGLREELQQKLKDVDQAADNLRKDITRDSLWDYKSQVKAFLEIVTKRLYLVRGKGILQTMKVIDTVNAELEELTRIAMEGQKNFLRLVEKIEEIRGLLLDLYT